MKAIRSTHGSLPGPRIWQQIIFLLVCWLTALALASSLAGPALATRPAAPEVFGTNGRVTTDFALQSRDCVREVLLLADGKFLAASECGYPLLQRYNSNGSLDTSFGSGGEASPVWGGFHAYDLALQSDGKIIVAGDAVSGYAWGFALARYLSNGKLDSSFGTGGLALADFNTEPGAAYAVALQPDGKIVAAGKVFSETGVDDFGVARFNTNGSLDTSFDGDGRQTIDFFSESDSAAALALQQDGKIVVGGTAEKTELSGQYAYFALSRLNTNGSLDAAFGASGKTTLGFSVPGGDSRENIGTDLLIQPDGKTVMAGASLSTGPSDYYYFALARFTTNGSLDSTFDGDGKVITEFSSYNSYANALVRQADGKLVVAGDSCHFNYSGSCSFLLARYTTGGSLDTSFDTDGKLSTALGNRSGAESLAYNASTGTLLAGGWGETALSQDIAMARYTTTGSLDTSFDGDGKLLVNRSGGNDNAYALALQTDGKVIAAGRSYSGLSYSYKASLARYNTDGSLDTGFDGDGRLLLGSSQDPRGVVVQPDGKLIVAGFSGSSQTKPYTTSKIWIARLCPNGQFDDGVNCGAGGFGTGGNALGDQRAEIASSVALQQDGKIVVAGYSDPDFLVARFTTAGALDAGFGSGGKVVTPAEAQGEAYSVVIQTDQKILAGGYFKDANQTYSDFALVRYCPGGQLDDGLTCGSPALGGDGVVTTTFGMDAYISSVALQSDDKIVVAGTRSGDFLVARYLPDGSLDTSFDSDGWAAFDFGGTDVAKALRLQADGKIIVAGRTTPTTPYNDFNTIDYAILRLNTDGSPDETFAVAGMGRIHIKGNDYGYDLLLMLDGSILVGGYTFDGVQADYALAVFTPQPERLYLPPITR